MRKILHSRLPERLSPQIPPLLVELLVGTAAAVAMVGTRVPLHNLVGEWTPYALNYVAVVLAAVLAGWRSGAVALAVGQLLTWYVVVQPTWSVAIADADRLAGLLLACCAQALILLVIGLYQREVDKGTAERERRLELLHHALNEIDHRTRNNYQTVLALVQLQAQRSSDLKVRGALQQVADRIQAIAGASERLALHSGDIDRVRLDDHLCELCDHIERGLSREEIEVQCKIDDVAASPQKATSISLIVNELVTNAIKHAFNGKRAGNVWVTGKSGSAFELIVADDGQGMKAVPRSGRAGLGTRLVDSFVRQLGAEHEVTSSEKGTVHRLVIPNLD